ncbi:MAG: adenylosuccinate synthase [Bacteroidales bacterium]|nr:adenylosuccinate synthase [Bacteroidales bacterium]MDD3911514.1 adenylosuccinate synthase [Bacteroidales bacterium]MDD4420198.1 adenylosuccinate synthase [Bacteroidales bacterium]
MKVDVVLGLQWGDEGKGKIVDVLAKNYPVICRFQGGPNAGHSLNFEGKKFVLHSVPAGVFRKNTINIVGNGVVLDPIIFREECKGIEALGVPVTKRVIISKKAHLILPTHKIIDAASEASKGKTKIGSTLKGIGPTYMDKTGRNGLRVGDILAKDFKDRFNALKEKHKIFLKQFDFQYNTEEHEKEWMDAVNYLKKFQIVDSEYELNKYLKTKNALAEGAQGTLLDVDFGAYPFVTSSSTICAGACTGLGLSPLKIGKVYGIFKAYCTRVGAGPFPTELLDKTGEELRQRGCEFGATTGRPRRTGWLDIPALKYAIMLNGVTSLIMMKADVMDTFDKIKVAVAYKVDGQKTDRVPYDTYAKIEPVYKEFKGWKKDLSKCKKDSDFPAAYKQYISFIEKELQVPISVISVGPDRSQTIVRKKQKASKR